MNVSPTTCKMEITSAHDLAVKGVLGCVGCEDVQKVVANCDYISYEVQND